MVHLGPTIMRTNTCCVSSTTLSSACRVQGNRIRWITLFANFIAWLLCVYPLLIDILLCVSLVNFFVFLIDAKVVVCIFSLCGQKPFVSSVCSESISCKPCIVSYHFAGKRMIYWIKRHGPFFSVWYIILTDTWSEFEVCDLCICGLAPETGKDDWIAV